MYVVLFGPPGCGKGTLSLRMKKEQGYKHLSTGDLIRLRAKEDKSFADNVASGLKEGRLVSDDIVINLVREDLAKGSFSHVIFDGFPRTLLQAKKLEALLSSLKKEISVVINFVVPDDVLIKRIEGRFMCKACGAVYNRFFKQTRVEGVCDVCDNIEFFQRLDDTSSVLKERLVGYYSEVESVLSYYSERKLLKSIDASLEPQLIYERVRSLTNQE